MPSKQPKPRIKFDDLTEKERDYICVIMLSRPHDGDGKMIGAQYAMFQFDSIASMPPTPDSTELVWVLGERRRWKAHFKKFIKRIRAKRDIRDSVYETTDVRQYLLESWTAKCEQVLASLRKQPKDMGVALRTSVCTNMRRFGGDRLTNPVFQMKKSHHRYNFVTRHEIRVSIPRFYSPHETIKGLFWVRGHEDKPVVWFETGSGYTLKMKCGYLRDGKPVEVPQLPKLNSDFGRMWCA